MYLIHVHPSISDFALQKTPRNGKHAFKSSWATPSPHPPFPRPCWRKTCVYQILTIVELLLLYLISSTVTRPSFWLLDHDDQDYSLWQNDKLVNNVILTPTAVDKDKLLLFLSYGFFHEMWFGGQNLERRFFFFSTIKKRKQVTTPALYTMWYCVNGKETSFHPT